MEYLLVSISIVAILVSALAAIQAAGGTTNTTNDGIPIIVDLSEMATEYVYRLGSVHCAIPATMGRKAAWCGARRRALEEAQRLALHRAEVLAFQRGAKLEHDEYSDRTSGVVEVHTGSYRLRDLYVPTMAHGTVMYTARYCGSRGWQPHVYTTGAGGGRN